jgi:hypothetical protein
MLRAAGVSLLQILRDSLAALLVPLAVAGTVLETAVVVVIWVLLATREALRALLTSSGSRSRGRGIA